MKSVVHFMVGSPSRTASCTNQFVVVNEKLRRWFQRIRSARSEHHRHAQLLQRPLRLARVAGEEAAVLPDTPVERDRGVAISEAELLRRVVEVAVERFFSGVDRVAQ